MTFEQYKASMLESTNYELAKLDKFIGTISGMKGNAKFDEIKQNCKVLRKHLLIVKELCTDEN